MSENQLISFPCDYTIKIIGKASDDFDARMVTIINKHQEKPFEGCLIQRDSKQKNYVSYTVTLYIHSKEQLEALFDDLKKDQDVMMVL